MDGLGLTPLTTEPSALGQLTVGASLVPCQTGPLPPMNGQLNRPL